jgi:hypothetical protein
VSEQLAAEIAVAVLIVIGSGRPDAQCRYSIKTKVAEIVGRYSVSEVATK